jgi:hypothetical protein
VKDTHFIGRLALSISLALLLGCGGPVPLSLDCAPAAVGDPSTPIQYGQREVDRALTDAGLKQRACLFTVWDRGVLATFSAARISLGTSPESFAAMGTPHGVAILGRDAAGAMYGALEVAERIRTLGAKAFPLNEPLSGSPLIRVRGANLFLNLPGPQEANWWFRSSAFWTEYLDLLARARFNFLDLHGMYNPDNTIFPNVLLYFATSKTYPQLGVHPEDRKRNLEMLNTVIRMAATRGIQVGVMSYRADLSLTGWSPPQQQLADVELKTYTREAVADFSRSVPALWRLGFRIGESGRPAHWYQDTFIAGARQANTGVEIYTRTWLSSRNEVLATARAAGGHFMLEAKLNGEQLALPYPIAGGVFAQRWQHYSYEEYLNNPDPWLFVFQIRAGGTHRIFRQASLQQTRRLMRSLADTHAGGFSYEFPHAYTPQRDFYHAPFDAYSEWTFRRDELQYLMVGRLAYDPDVPEAVFRAALERRVGTDALWEPLQAASEIVPWMQAAHTCGPDHRDAAPDLELGGPVGYWAQVQTAPSSAGTCRHPYHGPFDSFAIAAPHEDAVELVSGKGGTRLSPREIAQRMLQNARDSRRADSLPIDPSNAEARDLRRECVALADLGEFFAHKLRAATALAVYAQSGQADYLSAARAASAQSGNAFRALANDTAYIAPFLEELRMTPLGFRPFHWSAETARLAGEEASIDAVVPAVAAAAPGARASLPPAASWLDERRAAGPGLKQLQIIPAVPWARSWVVTAVLRDAAPPGSSVSILWKRFANNTNWIAVPARGRGNRWSATIRGGGAGALFAVEVAQPGQDGWRYPDVLAQTPYATLAPGAK